MRGEEIQTQSSETTTTTLCSRVAEQQPQAIYSLRLDMKAKGGEKMKEKVKTPERNSPSRKVLFAHECSSDAFSCKK